MLLVLAIKARLGRLGVIVANLGFGLWHVPDALHKAGPLPPRLLVAAGGPALLHGADNVLLNLW